MDWLRNDPSLRQGLLAAGLGIMAANDGRRSGISAIGQGGLLGLQAYQQATDRAKAEGEALDQKQRIEAVRQALIARFPDMADQITSANGKSLVELHTRYMERQMAPPAPDIQAHGGAFWDMSQRGPDGAPLRLAEIPQQEKPTDFERTLEGAGIIPGSPEWRAAMARRAQTMGTHAPGTNVFMGVEREEAKAKGKANVELYAGVRDAAMVARKLNAQLESQRRTLESGFETGFGTEAVAGAAMVLGALGVEGAERYATNAQTFNAAAKEVVLQKQLAQKGPQTESDAKRIEQTGSQLGNTPAANKFIIDVAIAQNKRDIEMQKFFDDYWRENKTYEGAEQAWYDGEGGRSLFDRPEMRKYLSGGAPPGNNDKRPPLSSFQR